MAVLDCFFGDVERVLVAVFLAENRTQLQLQPGQHAELSHAICYATLAIVDIGDLIEREAFDSLFDAG